MAFVTHHTNILLSAAVQGNLSTASKFPF